MTDDHAQVVKEPSAVLMLDHEVRIGQNSDHREIARFLSLQDRNFRPLLKRLEIFKDDIVKKLQSFTCTSPWRETVSLGIAVPMHALCLKLRKSQLPYRSMSAPHFHVTLSTGERMY